MAKIGTLQSLLYDSEEEEEDLLDPEFGLFSANEMNKPILDFSDSESDSDDELPARNETFREAEEQSLNSVLSGETSQPIEISVPDVSEITSIKRIKSHCEKLFT